MKTNKANLNRGLIQNLGAPESWWGRYRLLLAGALILSLSFTAMGIIWSNVRDMEKKRNREHQALATGIGETAKIFLVNRQYDYFLEILKLIQKTPFVEHVLVLIEGRVAFQAGRTSVSTPSHWLRHVALKLFPSAHQVRQQLDYQEGKTAEMTITFSLEEFRKPQFYILGAFAVIVLLLMCLGWVGYRLYLTHRQLVVAEQTKEHMIFSITHDAKQDLSVIQGKMSSLLPKLKHNGPPLNMEKDLRLTMESAQAIERYLNNLKDQQGLVSGRVEILCEPVCLQEIIVSVTEAFAEKMHIRNMEIKIGTLEKNRKVLADLQIIKRVIMNLLHNAMKYSPAGGEVSIWQEAREDKLYTYVRDQGQGIPVAEWQRIFQPYVQLDPKKDGMGLGLATARRLVELMGGCLDVGESVVGKGTTFCLTLPWAQGK